MPLIPFPNVPNYPGVPSIPRTMQGSPAINMSLANPAASPTAATPVSDSAYAEKWSIFDSASGAALYTPTDGGTLSFFSFRFSHHVDIDDFPTEATDPKQGAPFASYNKVWVPAKPVLVLVLNGTANEKGSFLAALETACLSTNLYVVTTPDSTYGQYSIESYSYDRSARHNATMLMVEISLKQILQVQPNFSSSSTAINSPQSPSAVPQVNNGSTQAQSYSGSAPDLSSTVGVN